MMDTSPRLTPEAIASVPARQPSVLRLFGLLRARAVPAPKSIMPPSASTAHGLVALSEVLAETHGGDSHSHIAAAIDLALRLSERGWSITKDQTA